MHIYLLILLSTGACNCPVSGVGVSSTPVCESQLVPISFTFDKQVAVERRERGYRLFEIEIPNVASTWARWVKISELTRRPSPGQSQEIKTTYDAQEWGGP